LQLEILDLTFFVKDNASILNSKIFEEKVFNTPLHINILSLFSIGKHLFYGKNKEASTFRRFTLFGTKRKKSAKTACGLVLGDLFLEYTFVFQMK
jgi:hypothetical protein